MYSPIRSFINTTSVNMTKATGEGKRKGINPYGLLLLISAHGYRLWKFYNKLPLI